MWAQPSIKRRIAIVDWNNFPGPGEMAFVMTLESFQSLLPKPTPPPPPSHHSHPAHSYKVTEPSLVTMSVSVSQYQCMEEEDQTLKDKRMYPQIHPSANHHLQVQPLVEEGTGPSDSPKHDCSL